MLAPVMTAAGTVKWVGPNGSYWDLAGSWSPALPGAADDVNLQAFDTVFRQSTVSVKSFNGTGKLTVTGGSLSTSGTSSVGGLFMSGGGLSGTGTLTAASLNFATGTLGYAAGGTANIVGTSSFDGTATQSITNGYRLNLRGNGAWSLGNGSLMSGGDSGILGISAAATFTDAGTSQVNTTKSLGGIYGYGTVANAGTYVRSGLGTTQVNAGFNNTGTLNVTAGQMILGGGGSSTGAVNVAAGATLAFNTNSYYGNKAFNFNGGSVTNNGTVQLTSSSGTVYANSGSSLTGSGTLAVAGGNLQVNAGSKWTPAQLTLSSGYVYGPGTLNATNLTFSGGTFGSGSYAAGTTNVSGTTTIDGTASQSIDGYYTLNLNGSSTWSAGNGALMASNNTGTFATGAGATFTDAGAGSATTTKTLGGYYGYNTVANAGTYVRSGLGTTQVNAGFNNTGTLNVTAGQMILGGGGSSTGAVNVAAGATLAFNTNSYYGNKAFNFNGGSVTNNGTVQLTSSSGTVYANSGSSLTGSGTLAVAGGNLQVNAGSKWTPAQLTLSSGYVYGPGTLNATNLTFSGGTFGSGSYAAGTTNVSGTTTIDGTASQSIDGYYTLNLNGSSTWSAGNGALMASNNTGTFATGAGATFTDAGAGSATTTKTLGGYYGYNTVANAGTYVRSGLGTTQVNAGFNNTGTLNVTAGQMILGGGGSSTGAVNVAAGATLAFNTNSYYGNKAFNFNGGSVTNNGTVQLTSSSGTVYANSGSSLTGSGTLAVAGGNLQVNAGSKWTPAQLTLSSGYVYGPGTLNATNLTFSGGTFGSGSYAAGTTNVSGTTTIDGTASQSIDGYYTLNLNGSSTWSAGNGALMASNNTGTFATGAGATFTDAGAGSATTTKTLGGYYGYNTVANAGTYVRSGLGTTQVNAGFNNTGTLNVTAGQMILGGGGSSTGAVNVAAGATLAFNTNSYYGNKAFNFNGGSVTNNGTVQLTSSSGTVYANSGSSLTGSGTLAVAGGNLQVNAGSKWTPAQLTLSSGYVYGPGTLNATNLTFSGGTFGSGSYAAGTTNVSGTTTIDGTASQSIAGYYALNLNGASTWSAGNGNLFNYSDTGSLNIGNGQSFTDAGALSATTTKTLGGSYGYSTVNNAGTYVRNGAGTTQVNASFNNAGIVAVNAGTMTFAKNGIQGTGTLKIGTSGAVSLASANSTVGTLNHAGASGSLVLNAGTITVSNDYTNANWGSGNSFNRLANITTTGTGQHILAAGDVAQTVATGSFAGAAITNGASDTPTLTLGNVHVGTQVVSFNVANTGTYGPSLRGALQPGVNGGNITDTRLTGFNNWGPAPVGGTAAATFSFAVASAGVYTPIAASQTLAVVNNFENTNSQVLTIKSGSGAAAYNLASAATVTSATATLAAQRIGGTLGSALTIKNTAPAGNYTEKLDAAFGATSGGASNNGGTASLIAPNGSSSTLQARVDTTTAGAKSGTVSVLLTSDGAGTSGLGLTSLATQKVNVSGTVYGTAIAKVNTPTIDFGIVHKGDTVAAKTISISNAAPVVAGYTDSLVGKISGGSTTLTATGSFAGIAAGATDASSLKAGLVTTAAGSFSSTATIALTSHDSVLTDLALASSTVNLKAQVNNYATDAFGKVSGGGTFSGSGATYTLNFGTLKSGATGLSASLDVLNTATGFADLLGGSFLTGKIGTGDDFSILGFDKSFTGLAAGGKYTGLTVNFGGTKLGSFDEVVTLKGIGSNASGYSGALADLQLHLVGTVSATGTSVFSDAGNAAFAARSFDVSAVPEPSTYALTISGLLAMVAVRRRARNSAV